MENAQFSNKNLNSEPFISGVLYAITLLFNQFTRMKSQTTKLELLTILCTLIATLWATSGKAQDVIILKTGERIEAKIIEISDVAIKYREFIDPDGIIFTMARGKIREIRYETGRREQEVPEELQEAYYVDDAKNAVKLNFTGLNARVQCRDCREDKRTRI